MNKFNWPIIGHKSIVKYLQTVITNDTLGHAYLFHGGDGLGKKKLSDLFIKSIYCTGKIVPCNDCPYCTQLENKVHPDVIFIEPAEDKKNITIEQVRTARSKMHHGTFLNSHKVILIRSADTLSVAAANALLKVLEEPTQKTIFILIATSLDRIPATILSRVQLIKFMPIPAIEIQKYLIGQNVDKNIAYELSHLSHGYPGSIIPLVDHPRLLKEYKENFATLLKSLSTGIVDRFQLVESLTAQSKSNKSKVHAKNMLANLSSLIRDAILIKNMAFDKITHTALKKDLANFSENYSSKKLAQILENTEQTKTYLKSNVNIRLALENLMLQF